MRFTTPQKIRIVQLFAEGYGALEVARRLSEEFPELANERVSRKSIQYYNPNPTLKSASNLSPALNTVYRTARKHFDEKVVGAVPWSKEWRIHELTDLMHRSRNNPKVCANLIGQIAKEKGQLFSRKGETEDKESEEDLFDLINLSPTEQAQRVRALMDADEDLRNYVVELLRTVQ